MSSPSLSSSENQPLNLTAVLLTLLTVVLWAGTPVAVRFATERLPPVTVAGLRFAIAAVFMAGWSTAHRVPVLLRPRALVPPLIAGLLLFLQIGLFTVGIHISNASHGSVFINTFVFWLVAIEHFILHSDRLNWRRLSGLILAAAAVGLILGTTQTAPDTEVAEAPALEGDLLLLLSAFILAVKILYTKSAVRTLHPDQFVMWHAIFGTVLFALWSLAVEGFDPSELLHLDDPGLQRALWGVAYQGVMVAGLCFAIQARLLKKHSASRISVFSFATPLFGILFAVLLRGDPVSPWLFVAGAAVAAGIYLVNARDAAESRLAKTS